MPFVAGPQPPNLSRLKSTLLTSGIQESNNPLWQVINQLIDALQGTVTTVAEIEDDSGGGETGADPDLTYITVGDETADLPNSSQLVAGFGIDLDTSTPNQVIIKTDGYWAPLTDGDLDETDLIFADGDCIVVYTLTP